MNDSYNEYITRNGHRYRYDPDYDCYYRVFSPKELTHWHRYSWIYIAAILAAVCYYVEFLR